MHTDFFKSQLAFIVNPIPSLSGFAEFKSNGEIRLDLNPQTTNCSHCTEGQAQMVIKWFIFKTWKIRCSLTCCFHTLFYMQFSKWFWLTARFWCQEASEQVWANQILVILGSLWNSLGEPDQDEKHTDLRRESHVIAKHKRNRLSRKVAMKKPRDIAPGYKLGFSLKVAFLG